MVREKKQRSHVLVRLTPELHGWLCEGKAQIKAKSIAPVIEAVLLERLLHGKPPTACRRDPRSAPVNDLFISAGLVTLLRDWARQADVTIGDMIFTLLSERFEFLEYSASRQ